MNDSVQNPDDLCRLFQSNLLNNNNNNNKHESNNENTDNNNNMTTDVAYQKAQDVLRDFHRKESLMAIEEMTIEDVEDVEGEEEDESHQICSMLKRTTIRKQTAVPCLQSLVVETAATAAAESSAACGETTRTVSMNEEQQQQQQHLILLSSTFDATLSLHSGHDRGSSSNLSTCSEGADDWDEWGHFHNSDHDCGGVYSSSSSMHPSAMTASLSSSSSFPGGRGGGRKMSSSKRRRHRQRCRNEVKYAFPRKASTAASATAAAAGASGSKRLAFSV